MRAPDTFVLHHKTTCMRNTLLALLIATTAATPLTTDAQCCTTFGPWKVSPTRTHYARFKQRALNPAKYAARTTATDVRLTSVLDIDYNGAGSYDPLDSFTVSFPGTNGGVFDADQLTWLWNFDQAIGYMYGSSSYDPASMKLIQTFNTAGYVDTQRFMDWNSTTSAWENTSQTINTYNTSNDLLTATYQDWNSTTSAWENTSLETYTYSATHRTATYLTQDWNSSTMAWENNSRSTYTRDGSDRLTTDVTESWVSSAWVNSSKDTYTYDGSGNRVSDLTESWNGAAWENSGMTMSRNFVTLHQPQTIVYMDWNTTTSAFDSTNRDQWVFNSYGKPDLFYGETWNATSSAWEYSSFNIGTIFHYATYAAGVDEVATSSIKATLYPMPATDNMTIDATWNEPQAFSAAITDVSGRMYTSWSMPAASAYHEAISVGNLPPGNYILTLQGAKEKVVKQFAVVR